MNSADSVKQSNLNQSRVPEPAWLRIAKVLTLLVGLVIIFTGVSLGSLYLLLSFLAPGTIGSPLNAGIIGLSMFALALGLGGALVFETVSTLSRRSSSVFHLPSPIAFIVSFVVVIALGLFVSWAGQISWVLFPFFYVLGIGLPVAWVMSVAGGRLVRSGTLVTWRETILQLSSGAFVTTSLALLFELLVVLGFLVTAAVAVLLTPGGPESIEALVVNLQSPTWIDHPGNIEELITSPVVMVSLFFLLAVAVPMIEELLKAIGVILMGYRHPSREQALWWGLLGGAGFAFAEGLFNGNLAAGELSWGALAPMRFGATILHCTTGALMGLGWYALLRHKRPLLWLTRYVQACALHAVWNALSLGLAFASPETTSHQPNVLTGTLPGLVLTGSLFLLAIAMVTLLMQLTRQLPATEEVEAPH